MSDEPITPARQREMRDLAAMPYKTLQMLTGVPASALCNFELGMTPLRAEKRRRIERVLMAEIIDRARRIAGVLANEPVLEGNVRRPRGRL
jgi:hypothetical protein